MSRCAWDSGTTLGSYAGEPTIFSRVWLTVTPSSLTARGAPNRGSPPRPPLVAHNRISLQYPPQERDRRVPPDHGRFRLQTLLRRSSWLARVLRRGSPPGSKT